MPSVTNLPCINTEGNIHDHNSTGRGLDLIRTSEVRTIASSNKPQCTLEHNLLMTTDYKEGKVHLQIHFFRILRTFKVAYNTTSLGYVFDTSVN